MKTAKTLIDQKLVIYEPDKLAGPLQVFLFSAGSGASTESGVKSQVQPLLSEMKKQKIEALVVCIFGLPDDYHGKENLTYAMINAAADYVDKMYATDPERRTYIGYSLSGQEPRFQVVNSAYTGFAYKWLSGGVSLSSGLDAEEKGEFFEFNEIKKSKNKTLYVIGDADLQIYLQRLARLRAYAAKNEMPKLKIVQLKGTHSGANSILSNPQTYQEIFTNFGYKAEAPPVVTPPATGGGSTPKPKPYAHPWATDNEAPALEPAEFGVGVGAPWIDENFKYDRYDPLIVSLGFNTMRHSIGFNQVKKWGAGIIKAELENHKRLGIDNVLVYLDFKATDFKGLFDTVIDLNTKAINPKNELANYIADFIRTNQGLIKTISFVNEPDLTDWRNVEKWKTRDPLANELPNLGGTIRDLHRIYQVGFAVVKLLDPKIRVAFNASYPEFYTRYMAQKPNGSQPVGAEYDEYLYHYYPHYGAKNAGNWTADFAVKSILDRGAEIDGIFRAAGFDGKKYVAKRRGIGELGFLHQDFTAADGTVYKGSNEYQRDATRGIIRGAQAAGMDHIYFYTLNDTPKARGDEYDYTGFVQDLRGGVKDEDIKFNGAVVRGIAR